MTSRVMEEPGRLVVEHRLTVGGRANRVKVVGRTPGACPAADSDEHFFKEHQWGFGIGRRGACVRYEVTHPAWHCYAVESYELDWDWAGVYGEEFAFLKDQTPGSVVLAAGSGVKVFPKGKIGRVEG